MSIHNVDSSLHITSCPGRSNSAVQATAERMFARLFVRAERRLATMPAIQPWGVSEEIRYSSERALRGLVVVYDESMPAIWGIDLELHPVTETDLMQGAGL